MTPIELANENGNRALFLDFTGTLVKMDATGQLPLDADGNVVVEMMPGVVEKLRPMRDYLFLIFTNQAGIARGRLSAKAVEEAIAQVDHHLGDTLTGWQVCPHDDGDGCGCRKPRGGMIIDLARTYGVDLARSIVVGDQEVDRLAAEAAGAGSFVFAADFFAWK